LVSRQSRLQIAKYFVLRLKNLDDLVILLHRLARDEVSRSRLWGPAM
jgi:hypothetical protein